MIVSIRESLIGDPYETRVLICSFCVETICRWATSVSISGILPIWKFESHEEAPLAVLRIAFCFARRVPEVRLSTFACLVLAVWLPCIAGLAFAQSPAGDANIHGYD